MSKAEKILTAVILAAFLLAISFFTVVLPQYRKIMDAQNEYDLARKERDAVYSLLKGENVAGGEFSGAEVYDSIFFHELTSFEADETVRGILKKSGLFAEEMKISDLYVTELSAAEDDTEISYPLKDYIRIAAGADAVPEKDADGVSEPIKAAAVDVSFKASGTRRDIFKFMDMIYSYPQAVRINKIEIPYTVTDKNVRVLNNMIVQAEVSLTMFCIEPLLLPEGTAKTEEDDASDTVAKIEPDVPDLFDYS